MITLRDKRYNAVIYLVSAIDVNLKNLFKIIKVVKI